MPDGRIVTCDITAGALDALCEVWKCIIADAEAGIVINMLLDCARSGVQIESYLPGEGKVEILNKSGRNLFVRVPSWVSSSELELRIDGDIHAFNLRGSLLPIARRQGTQKIAITFPVRRVRTIESMAFQRYTIDWQGDQITAMSPPAKYLPMFPPISDV